MEWAALISWIVTAGGGFVLLAVWLSRGGMQQQRDAGNRIKPPLILSHFLLAGGGLVVWVIYVVTDSDALAWIALAVLGVVAALGFTMFAIWLRQRRARRSASRNGDGCRSARRRSTSSWVFPGTVTASS